MADPRNELADIIVPVAPEMAAHTGGLPLWMWAIGMLGVAGVLLVMWQWRRHRFERSLKAITGAVARQQGTPAELSHLLDTWARARFSLLRLEAAQCPQGLDADAWADWVNTLTQLRFAAATPDGMDALADLCETARNWKPHA
ncbi:MAG TPA: hypothetical protein VIN38_04805 [Thiobacillus sp.]